MLAAVGRLRARLRLPSGLLPRADVQRIVLVDSWLSSVFVGRSVATIAELCFAAQWALLLHELSHEGRRAHDGRARGRPDGRADDLRGGDLLVVRGAVHQLPGQHAGAVDLDQHVALLALALGLGLWWEARARAVARVPRRGPSRGWRAGASSLFMCTVDVPMYFTRFLADKAAGRAYLPLGPGPARCNSTRWVVTHALADWHEEMAWMGLYFSIAAVWASLALCVVYTLDGHLPQYRTDAAAVSWSPQAGVQSPGIRTP